MGGHNRIIFVIGTRFERLVVIGSGQKKLKHSTTFAYRCRCDCGQELLVLPGNLKAGSQRSCGCLQRDSIRERATTHGHKKGDRETKVYRAWLNMRSRCQQPTAPNYRRYGGRGIAVCAQWSDFTVFLRDVGYPPENSRRYSIGRKNNDGDYTPDNSRWEIPIEQGRNREPKFHRYVTAFGETKIASAWLDDPRCKATRAALYQRLKRGMPAEEALSKPPMSQAESSALSRFVRWNGQRPTLHQAPKRLS